MIKRGKLYSLATFWRYYLRNPIGLATNFALYRICPFQVVNGIRVMDPRGESRDRFTRAVAGAIAMLEQHDKIRFRRLKAETRVIINRPSVWGFGYYRPLRMCCIELDYWLRRGDPVLTARLIAAALVHEATLANLVSRGVLRTPKNCKRFDSVRRKEAQRFLRTLGMEKTPWDEECLFDIPKRARWKLIKATLRQMLKEIVQ